MDNVVWKLMKRKHRYIMHSFNKTLSVWYYNFSSHVHKLNLNIHCTLYNEVSFYVYRFTFKVLSLKVHQRISKLFL